MPAGAALALIIMGYHVSVTGLSISGTVSSPLYYRDGDY
jgi:hypothetical protein